MNKNIDIMRVRSFPEYDILYCDPPWEQRMVKFFQTKLRKDTGVVVDNHINDLLYKLGDLADRKKPLYIEYSLMGYRDVVRKMTKLGHKFHSATEHTQANGNRFMLCAFNTDCEIDSSLKAGKVVEHVVKHHLCPIVFDPFAGIGFTAKHVYKGKGRYIGYELNPLRYERMNKVCEKYENI